MKKWPTQKLEQLTTKIGSGATPRGGQNGYVEAGVSLIRSQNILDNGMNIAEIAHITDEAAHKLRGVTVQANDVLINITGDSIARCSIVDERVLPARVNQHVSILRTTAELDPLFLQKFLVTTTTKSLLMAISSGGTRQALTRSDLAKLSVPVPPLAEQRAIAEVLGALDDKIAANNKLIRLADSLSTSISVQAFSTGNLVPLLSIADITMGTSPKGEEMNEDGIGVPFFQGIRDFGVRYPSERVSTTSPTRFANELDTLFSVRAPVGKTNLAQFSCSIGRGLSALSSLTSTPYALFQAVRNSPSWSQYNSEGTVFGSINRTQIESAQIKWIDGDQLQRLENTLSSIEDLIRTFTLMNETLSLMRDTLLPQLMSGKIRVREAESIVEDAL